MFTFTRAVWLRRSQPTLWEPAPVIHLVIRSQDEPAQLLQPNQHGEENDVAHAAELVVTDNAVLSDLPRSKDTTMNPAHPSVTSLRCVHQFVRSQSQIDKYKSSNSCGHDPQQYIFFSQDFSYNQYFSLFFYSVRGSVGTWRREIALNGSQAIQISCFA